MNGCAAQLKIDLTSHLDYFRMVIVWSPVFKGITGIMQHSVDSFREPKQPVGRPACEMRLDEV